MIDSAWAFPLALEGEALKKLFSCGGEEQLAKYLEGTIVEIEQRERKIVDVRPTPLGYAIIQIDDEIFFPRHLSSARMTLSAEQIKQLCQAAKGFRSLFDELFENGRKQESRKELAKQELIDNIIQCILSGEVLQARRIFDEQCLGRWSIEEFQRALQADALARQFAALLKNGPLSSVDEFYRHSLRPFVSVDTVTSLKAPRIKKLLEELEIQADDEQVRAIASPFLRVKIQARAGSGKTRTLSARAVIAIIDEKLDPNQVLILAFNKTATVEIKERVEKILKSKDFNNTRTFHSLAHQLLKPSRKILFDQGEQISTQEQSVFAQRLLRRIINPAFQTEMVQFFRKELEEIENIGRNLQPDEYYIFRQALEHVTLGGQWIRADGELVRTNGERVKSKGEKFIADFLFEHDIPYRYERAWVWKTPFLGGTTYKPDFSFFANGYDIILEHWAFDPSDANAQLPSHWQQSAADYREQIEAKRNFWKSKSVLLIETHAGMLRDGRKQFEEQLKSILMGAGINCVRLPETEIIKRVFQNDFMISRMAGLFIQFISRAKKQAWGPDDVERLLKTYEEREARTKSFHRLALRAFREYELMKQEESAMDFDDLLIDATKVVEEQGQSATIHLGHGRTIALGRLKWILLDEYQDFSPLYYRLLETILKICPDIRLVAVGDDWQAINSFAGAELKFFNNFGHYFSGGECASLTTNYRSDANIVRAGNALMVGRGQPANVSPVAQMGGINVRALSSTFVQFVRNPDSEEAWRADQVFLPAGTDGRTTENALRLAQVLKTCIHILRPAFDESQIRQTVKAAGRLPHVLLLSRTGFAYGLSLADLQARLVSILTVLTGAEGKLLNRLIRVSTAHGAKGGEAHTVIVLDATAKQFPMVHPDNLLFEVFGITQEDVLEEERRLFYVAISRAVHRLVVLTEKQKESPYLKLISQENGSAIHAEQEKKTSLPATARTLRVLARHIYGILDISVDTVASTTCPISTPVQSGQDRKMWDDNEEPGFVPPF